ncbi:MAG: sugar phosphate isomerase/epimerase [Treponemataceae bacterium]
MRLGAMNCKGFEDPDAWIAELRRHGYRTSVFPTDLDRPDADLLRYAAAAKKADIVIAEVGGWGNPLADSDRGSKEKSLALAKRALYVADETGARCAVGISGSRGEIWDGPDERNLTSETYEMVVATVREIIDEVKPKRTFYTLEPMPWMYPCDIETQRSLLRDVDRKAFAVHFDPVNMITSTTLYYQNASFLRAFIREFGSLIKACHAKDSFLKTDLTIQFEERRPGEGKLDYAVYLKELERVDTDMPLLIEHLKKDEDYEAGARSIRETAETEGIQL